MQRNEELKKEIAVHSKESEKILARNQVLAEENTKLKREAHLMKKTNAEMQKKVHAQAQTVKLLTVKIKRKHLRKNGNNFIGLQELYDQRCNEGKMKKQLLEENTSEQDTVLKLVEEVEQKTNQINLLNEELENMKKVFFNYCSNFKAITNS